MTVRNVKCNDKDWYLKLREERRLRMFQNKVLSKMFGSKRDEVTGNCTKLHTEDLDLCHSSNIVRLNKSRRMRWVGHVERMGVRRVNAAFGRGEPEGRRPVGKPRSTWVDNIKMDLGGGGEKDWGGWDWFFWG